MILTATTPIGCFIFQLPKSALNDHFFSDINYDTSSRPDLLISHRPI
jgi:hypothetical protein